MWSFPTRGTLPHQIWSVHTSFAEPLSRAASRDFKRTSCCWTCYILLQPATFPGYFFRSYPCYPVQTVTLHHSCPIVLHAQVSLQRFDPNTFASSPVMICRKIWQPWLFQDPLDVAWSNLQNWRALLYLNLLSSMFVCVFIIMLCWCRCCEALLSDALLQCLTMELEDCAVMWRAAYHDVVKPTRQ